MLKDLDLLCVNTIRCLSIDAIQKANSGHPGLPLGAAPMAYVLWQNHLKHSPESPTWPNRDRFVLSAGHGSMLLYSLLHLTGYELSLDDIRNFRQFGSKTPGHPESFITKGVEATTGPLGQGAANAVGMAIAERRLAHLFNRPGFNLVDHYTYALVSDGDLMEGVVAEAASLAGHLKLGKLIYLYDSNAVTLDGPTTLTFSTENVAKRYESYGWQVLTVKNGDTDLNSINEAIQKAKTDLTRPSLIIVQTTIGFGSPNKQGTSASHGSPLGDEEVKLTKKTLGWEFPDPFKIPPQALAHFRKAVENGRQANTQWDTLLSDYEKKHPELYRQWQQATRNELPEAWDKNLPLFGVKDAMATRQASGKAIQALAGSISWLSGGDADLSCSTNTLITNGGSYEGQEGSGRNIHYGVREHAMASIANGIAYHGGLRHFVATFFCFSDYMKPAIRLAAMNHLPVIYVFTHDSVALGEDGPTHQPIEHLAALRAIPGLVTLRPCDANEVTFAWKWAVQQQKRPTAIVLTRQKVPTLDRERFSSAQGLLKGAYTLVEDKDPELIIIATGSEVELAVEAHKLLRAQGIKTRIVSMPSWEIFQDQPPAYRETILPPHIRARVSLEAATSFGWERWTGTDGLMIGIDQYGVSAPAEKTLDYFGFTAPKVVKKIVEYLEQLSKD